ncbi:MAG: TonB-dependent receptor [Candidatus Kapaibacterium sp.]
MKKILTLILLPLSLLADVAQDSISKKEYKSDEIIVIDDDFNAVQKNMNTVLNSVDDLLKYNNSIDLISRANFASEAIVRGYDQNRLSVTIDGMRMFSACIDKMDPITSYIEIENLKASEVSADKSDMSHGISVGGSMNFITNKPLLSNDFKIVLDNQFSSASDYYNSKGKVNYSYENFAALVSYSVKNAGNYSAGNSISVNNSSFRKENVKLNTLFKSSENTSHGLEYIYDHSADIGYPALIMDTRSTDMNMISYQLGMKNISDLILSWDTRVYYNSISHLMDDYDRSDEEIMNRAVMPGMYMPMDGTTETMGFLTKNKLLLGDDILKLSMEVFRMNAFSDMKMEMLETGREMYLINLGDIETYSGGIYAGYFTQLNESFLLKLNGRIDYITRTVNNEFARAIAESYWGDNYTASNLQLNTSVNLQKEFSESQSTNLTLSRVERAPTHLESFGFYIYNISDNSIYIGNPNLNKEKSYSVNLGYDYNVDDFNVKLNLYNDYIVDYIAGLKDDGVEVVETFAQSFKLFQNIGDANITGIEASLDYNINENFGLLTKVKYQYSQSLKYNESLPFTPPLSGLINFSYRSDDIVSVISAEFAAEQNNISKNITIEDSTPGYVILNWRNNYKINDTFTVRFGVENVFDKYYYTHFSINNLPNLGRNLYLGLVVGL